MIADLHRWGYHLVPWSRSPRKPMIQGWLDKPTDPTGFLRAYGDDMDWAVVPKNGVVVLDIEMKGGLDGQAEFDAPAAPVYLDCANDGKGGDITRDGAPLLTYDEWMGA